MATLQETAAYAAKAYGIDPNIFLRQLNQEGGWDNQTSSAGAVGVGQFMPGTWTSTINSHPELKRQFGITGNPAERTNQMASIFASAALMSDYVHQYGNYRDALIAYNAGPGTVGGTLPAETVTYLNKILGSTGVTGLPNTGNPGRTGASVQGDIFKQAVGNQMGPPTPEGFIPPPPAGSTPLAPGVVVVTGPGGQNFVVGYTPPGTVDDQNQPVQAGWNHYITSYQGNNPSDNASAAASMYSADLQYKLGLMGIEVDWANVGVSQTLADVQKEQNQIRIREVAETERANKAAEADALRQEGMTLAMKAVDTYLRGSELADARRLAAYQESRLLAPMVVPEGQQYFGGQEPGGALSQAMQNAGLPFHGAEIVHKQLTPAQIAVAPTPADMGPDLTGQIETMQAGINPNTEQMFTPKEMDYLRAVKANQAK